MSNLNPHNLKPGDRVRVWNYSRCWDGVNGVVEYQYEDGHFRVRVTEDFNKDGWEVKAGTMLAFTADNLSPVLDLRKPKQARLTLDEVKAIQRDGGRVRVLRMEDSEEAKVGICHELHGLSFEVMPYVSMSAGFVTVRDALGKPTQVPAGCLVDASGGLSGLEPGTLVTVRKPADFYPDEMYWLMDELDGKSFRVEAVIKTDTALKSPGERKLVQLSDTVGYAGCKFELRWLERAEAKQAELDGKAASEKMWLDVLSTMRAGGSNILVESQACTCTHSFFNSMKGCTCGAAPAERARKSGK